MVAETDFAGAIGLAEAAKLMRGRKGKAPSVESLRRWSNPQHGCHPQGNDGPKIVLLTVRVNGEILTLPSWVEAFEKERFRLGNREARPAPTSRPARRRSASHRRAEEFLRKEGVLKTAEA